MKTQEQKRAYQKAYRQKNLEKVKAAIRACGAKNKEKVLARALKWAQDNPERVAATKTRWQANNRDKHRKSAREYLARRRETDDNYKIRSALRGRIVQALKAKGVSKSKSVIELLGCDIQFLRGYLEARFLPGMTWANYGRQPGWNLDHRIPCAEFDLRDSVQQRQCFHYSNIQPLWAKDNLAKSAKRPATHQAELL